MEIIHTVGDTALARREFIYDVNINYGTMLPMGESTMSDSPFRGLGSTILAEFLLDCPPGHPKEFAGVTDFARASLVYFRSRGQQTELTRLVQIPLYYEEVKAFKPISEEDIRKRLAFARATGYVLLGPDECIAALHRYEDGYTFCEVFENNDLGTPRSIAGIFADGIGHHTTVREIANLNASETDQAISRWQGEYMWWAPQKKVVSALQVARMAETIQRLEAHQASAPPERRPSGAVVVRSFIANGSTDSTASLRPRSDGWMRYPTWQDAWYFGVWASPLKRQVLTYAEQDVTHVFCETEEQFQAELADLAALYGKILKPAMLACGPEDATVAFDCLSFLRGDSKAVKTVVFDPDGPAKDEKGRWLCPLMGELKVDHPDVAGLANGESLALDATQFQLNLLDRRSFDGTYSATATRCDGHFVIELQRSATGTVLVAQIEA